QIASGNINKSSGSKRNQIMQNTFRLVSDDDHQQCAQDGNRSREKVKKQTFFHRKSRVDQHPKITYFLRDLMQDHRQSGTDSHNGANHKTGRDNHSIEEIVKSISDQVHYSQRLRMRMLVLAVV